MISRRRLVRALSALAVGVVLTAVGSELCLRWLMFGEGTVAQALGGGLRRPLLYVDGFEHDTYNDLDRRFAAPEERALVPNFDPLVGWTGAFVVPRRYYPLAARDLKRRRPVLLYGDSYAGCATPAGQCFQALFEETPWAARFGLVNLGVGGYGLGQVWLLLRESLSHFADDDPVVVVGILVESDLERTTLSLRGWPKPRFSMSGDELVIEPPVHGYGRWAESHRRARCYTWRLLVNASALWPPALRARLTGRVALERMRRRVARRLLEEIQNELERRGLDYVFLLFHGEPSLRTEGPWKWEEQFLEQTLTELGAPFVSTRPYLEAWARRNDGSVAPLFGHEPPLRGHYNALGNRVAFEALLDGFETLVAH